MERYVLVVTKKDDSMGDAAQQTRANLLRDSLIAQRDRELTVFASELAPEINLSKREKLNQELSEAKVFGIKSVMARAK